MIVRNYKVWFTNGETVVYPASPFSPIAFALQIHWAYPARSVLHIDHVHYPSTARELPISLLMTALTRMNRRRHVE